MIPRFVYGAAAHWKLANGQQVLIEVCASFDQTDPPTTSEPYSEQVERRLLELLPQLKRQATPELAAREVALGLRKTGIPCTWARAVVTLLNWASYEPLGG